MKLVTLILLFGGLVQAANVPEGMYDITCRSVARGSAPVIQAKLKQITKGKVFEGVKTAFELHVQTLNNRTKPVIYQGTVLTEDVQLWFNSLDKKVYMMIYLDEEEPVTLKIKGQQDIKMHCALE